MKPDIKLWPSLANPAKLSMECELLTIVLDALTDIEPIEQTVCGAEAVISLMGPDRNGKGTPLSTGTKYILSAMKNMVCVESIAVSIASASDRNDQFLVTLIQVGMREEYHEIVTMSDAIRTSDFDWTLLRVPPLNNKPKTNKVRVGMMVTESSEPDFLVPIQPRLS